MSFLSKAFKGVKNLVSSAGGTLNDLTGVSDTAKQSYKYASKQMAQENANNIALWDMQNQYNTPAAQIARMAQAGIDVNPMTYAVGNGSMSTVASSPSTASPHSVSFAGSGINPISSLFSVMSDIQDMKYKQKMIDNYEKDHSSPYKDLLDFFKGLFGLGSPVGNSRASAVKSATKNVVGSVGNYLSKGYIDKNYDDIMDEAYWSLVKRGKLPVPKYGDVLSGKYRK